MYIFRLWYYLMRGCMHTVGRHLMVALVLCVCVCVCVIGHVVYSRLGIKGYLSFMVLSDMQHNSYG
jgi:hypothetical protein